MLKTIKKLKTLQSKLHLENKIKQIKLKTYPYTLSEKKENAKHNKKMNAENK